MSPRDPALRMARRARWVISAICVAATIATVVVGCSDDTPDQSDPPVAELPLPEQIDASTTSTTLAPARTGADYVDLGLTPDQAKCFLNSGLEQSFDVVLPDSAGGPIRVTGVGAEGDPVELVFGPDVSTGIQVERKLIGALASGCAPLDVIDRVAASLGAEDDAAAIAEDLPVLVERRRRLGATDGEVDCLRSGFLRAPARLSSLAADTRVVEEPCFSPGRLGFMRLVAIGTGLTTAGATEVEKTCLLSEVADRAALAETVALIESGEGRTPEGATPACVDSERLVQLALGIVAHGVDFDGEELAADGPEG